MGFVVGDGVLDVPQKRTNAESDLRDVEDAVPYTIWFQFVLTLFTHSKSVVFSPNILDKLLFI